MQSREQLSEDNHEGGEFDLYYYTVTERQLNRSSNLWQPSQIALYPCIQPNEYKIKEIDTLSLKFNDSYKGYSLA